jgi:hypothetical protein
MRQPRRERRQYSAQQQQQQQQQQQGSSGTSFKESITQLLFVAVLIFTWITFLSHASIGQISHEKSAESGGGVYEMVRNVHSMPQTPQQQMPESSTSVSKNIQYRKQHRILVLHSSSTAFCNPHALLPLRL